MYFPPADDRLVLVCREDGSADVELGLGWGFVWGEGDVVELPGFVIGELRRRA